MKIIFVLNFMWNKKKLSKKKFRIFNKVRYQNADQVKTQTATSRREKEDYRQVLFIFSVRA